MNNKTSFSLASLALLGSLASVACSSDKGGSDQPDPFSGNTPTTGEPVAPAGGSTDPVTAPPTGGVATGSDTDGVLDPTGNVTPPVTPPAEGTGDDGTVTPPVAPPEVPPVVTTGYPENTGADCEVTAADTRPSSANLPDPFLMHDGTRITTKAQWTCRRAEIKADIERFEIGPKPEPPTVAASLAGNTLNVVVTTAAGSITLSSNVTPAAGDAPHCVAIGMNGNSSLINGCTEVPFMHDQVVTYNQNGTINLNDPFYTVYPELRNQVANYAAWSWGISRIIDGLEQVKDQLNIDMSKVGVHGCSYAGKMALFGGAFDERVALTVAQESGGGGINSWRLSQSFSDRTGVQIEKIDNTNYSWFLQSMRGLAPNTLPHDHHELVAMVAPRAFVTFGNRNYEWLGDESGYKSLLAAQQVWSALGASAQFGYDFTTDHDHCSAAPSQVNTANTFVNKFLLGQDADTNIAIAPDPNPHVAGQPVYDLDQTKVIDWQTPTLQ
jgi:glucuronyl esterase-like protein